VCSDVCGVYSIMRTESPLAFKKKEIERNFTIGYIRALAVK
jgi:hypothetical protein